MSAHLNPVDINGKNLVISTEFGVNPGWVRS